MKRIFDLSMAVFLLCFLSVPFIAVALMVKLTSRGAVIYWSDRVGINNGIFRMPKFRTMRIDTPAVATHLMKNPESYLAPIGPLLRKFSLDELPQLYSILKGDISFVGPRPALYSQDDLVELRTEKGIHKLIPGITPVKWLSDCTGQAGWAQSGKLKVHSLIFKLLFSDSSLVSINNYKITRYIFRLDIFHNVKKQSGGHSDF